MIEKLSSVQKKVNPHILLITLCYSHSYAFILSVLKFALITVRIGPFILR